MPDAISPARRAEVIDALRRGTVPQAGLDLFAVGMERFERAIDEELDGVAAGRATFKAVRGEYGAGKTFFARWLAERAKRRGMAAAEVQISETETPLHKLETVYRRLVEQLSTAAYPPSALREVVDAWFYTLEEDVLAEGAIAPDDAQALAKAVDELLERRLADVARTTPAFAAALRAYRKATGDGDQATAQALLAWIGGQPNVVRRRPARRRRQGRPRPLRRARLPAGAAHDPARLRPPRPAARPRRDRDPAAGPLRRAGQGPQRAAPARRRRGLRPVPRPVPADHRDARVLRRAAGRHPADAARPAAGHRLRHRRAVRLAARRPDPAHRLRPAQARPARAARSATCTPAASAEAAAPGSARLVDDAYIADLAAAVAGELGGQVGVAPRVFLRKLVADVLDRVAEFDDFDPRQHYKLTLSPTELTATERNAAAFRPATADDVELDL